MNCWNSLFNRTEPSETVSALKAQIYSQSDYKPAKIALIICTLYVIACLHKSVNQFIETNCPKESVRGKEVSIILIENHQYKVH